MLNFSVTSEDIIEAFPEFKIINVNIKKTPSGTSRGFGYVQLESVVSWLVCLIENLFISLNFLCVTGGCWKIINVR